MIPTTIILSYFLLRKRYHILQQAGAGIIVVGIVLAKAMSGSSADSGNQVVFNVIFFCAVIPNAASSVFKDRLLGAQHRWLSMYQRSMGGAKSRECSGELASSAARSGPPPPQRLLPSKAPTTREPRAPRDPSHLCRFRRRIWIHARHGL